MKITFTNILIKAYDSRWAIVLILIFGFVVCAAMRGCSEQRLLDESNAVCRAVIVSKSATTKGKITKFEFMVDEVEYKGAGGGVTTSVGDSVNVKYVAKDPSINTLLYSPEYKENPPAKHFGWTLLLMLLGLLLFAFIFSLFFKSSIKKDENNQSGTSNN